MLERGEFGGEIVKEAAKFAARLIRLDRLCDFWRPLREVLHADRHNGIFNRRLVLVNGLEHRVEIAVALPLALWIVGMLREEIRARFDADKFRRVDMPPIFPSGIQPKFLDLAPILLLRLFLRKRIVVKMMPGNPRQLFWLLPVRAHEHDAP